MGRASRGKHDRRLGVQACASAPLSVDGVFKDVDHMLLEAIREDNLYHLQIANFAIDFSGGSILDKRFLFVGGANEPEMSIYHAAFKFKSEACFSKLVELAYEVSHGPLFEFSGLLAAAMDGFAEDSPQGRMSDYLFRKHFNCVMADYEWEHAELIVSATDHGVRMRKICDEVKAAKLAEQEQGVLAGLCPCDVAQSQLAIRL